MKYFTILCGLSILTFARATNYCAPDLCPSGERHIACGNSGAWSSKCPANARTVNLTPYIDLILDAHNSKRNSIASGKLAGFKPAKRMATMEWSGELAHIAAYNVKQCAMKHDQCRSTDSFKYAGQNLAYFGYSGAEGGYADDWLIKSLIDEWWSEYKDAEQEYIDEYPSFYSGPAIGHFTVMAADKNIRVGCAAARYTDGRFNDFLFACNYATTNIIGWPIYESGAPASGCTTGKNPQYTSLCSNREHYAGL